MRPTKYIFHFETCESYSVDPKRVDRLLIDGIGKCLRFTPNWHAKRWLCSALTLDLPLDVELKSELGYLPALYATPERLMDGDLTAVEVEWQMCRWLPFKLVRRFKGSQRHICPSSWYAASTSPGILSMRRVTATPTITLKNMRKDIISALPPTIRDGDAISSSSVKKYGKRRRSWATETPS